MWIAFDIERYEERGTRLAEYEIIGFSEDAGRGGEPHYGAVVLVTPRELYFVKFLVAVLKLAGGVGNEYRGENKRVVAVGRVRLDSEHVVRRKELVDPLGFVRSQWPGLHLVGLGGRLVVEPRLAVDDGERAVYIRLCRSHHRQSC